MYQLNTKTSDRLARYAAALGVYASKNENFAAELAGYLHSLPEALAPAPVVTVSQYAIPETEEIAKRRLLWFMSQLAQKPRPETEAARAILSAATRHIENPKALVIGLIGFAVPFIDLGLIKKKKKRLALRIVVDEAVYKTSTTAELLALTHRASTAFIAQELRTVFGNANELEPELAEWLFSDHETQVLKTPANELNRLATLLKEEALNHFVLTESKQILAIVLSPAIATSLSVGTELADNI